MLILHGSDLQIGKPYRPKAAEAFLALARALDPDLVVVSGDLTQRAKAREFALARAFLDALAPTPVVVTPGNHDVPLYRLWERIILPYRNWDRILAVGRNTVTRLEGATVVALDSSAPRRAVVGGRLRPAQLALARTAFAETPPGDARIVVTHHHFLPTPDRQGGRPLPRAAQILRAMEDMGVDLVLGGHVHQLHLATSRDVVTGSGPGIPLVACGTTASSRGRGRERDANSLNVIRLDSETIEVEARRLDPATGAFRSAVTRSFARPGGVRGSRGVPS